ncbi:hypothetical protein LP417_35385 (plasmid) [Polaromonas sp. P1-6]|nr:hypothetical protein LP417_35385 [Polaromonas sp. P1-6]
MKTRFTIFLLAVAVVVLSACTGGGDEFVGKWQETRLKVHFLEITKNGSGFIVQMTGPYTYNKRFLTKVKEGVLVSDEIGINMIEHIKATDSLLVGGKTYTKVKPGA